MRITVVTQPRPLALTTMNFRIKTISALAIMALATAGCTQGSNQMSDEASCAEIAKSINIINGFLSASTGDPTEATTVFAQVAKSFENVSKQTQGDKSSWALTMAESAADASLSIVNKDSTKLTSSLQALMSGMAFEATYCPNN